MPYVPPQEYDSSVVDDISWMDKTNCGEDDLFLFFPVKVDSVTYAKIARKICSPCKVRDECLMFGLVTERTQKNKYGMFGGQNASQRRRIHQALNKASQE